MQTMIQNVHQTFDDDGHVVSYSHMIGGRRNGMTWYYNKGTLVDFQEYESGVPLYRNTHMKFDVPYDYEQGCYTQGGPFEVVHAIFKYEHKSKWGKDCNMQHLEAYQHPKTFVYYDDDGKSVHAIGSDMHKAILYAPKVF